jgi:hypothetical protein
MIAAGASVKNLIVTGGMTGSNLKSHFVGHLANQNYGTVTRSGSEASSMFFDKGINVRVGGLIGRNSGIISECYSTGIIKLELVERKAINGFYPSLLDDLISDWNKGWAGGLVGVNIHGGIIRNSYSQVNVDIHAPGELTYGISGGLLASNLGTVQNCYSAGKVSPNKYRAD